MVITLAGLQEARRLAPQRPAGLMAVMTSMFGVGQILGLVLVSALALWRSGQTTDAGFVVS